MTWMASEIRILKQVTQKEIESHKAHVETLEDVYNTYVEDGADQEIIQEYREGMLQAKTRLVHLQDILIKINEEYPL